MAAGFFARLLPNVKTGEVIYGEIVAAATEITPTSAALNCPKLAKAAKDMEMTEGVANIALGFGGIAAHAGNRKEVAEEERSAVATVKAEEISPGAQKILTDIFAGAALSSPAPTMNVAAKENEMIQTVGSMAVPQERMFGTLHLHQQLVEASKGADEEFCRKIADEPREKRMF